MSKVKLMKWNNLELLKKLPDNSVDSIVSDPPYGLSFMGKKWDYDVPSVEFWKEAYRVLKPGGHVLSFGGTRTYHRMVVNMEDAGFEIRDQIMWLYGSGFPKSHNISKAIAKINGEDVKVGKAFNVAGQSGQRDLIEPTPIGEKRDEMRHKPTTKEAIEFEGWGTALKPANEPICLARKPLSEKSVAENVLKWKTGGINVDGCRIGTDEELGRNNKTNPFDNNVDNGGIWNRGSENVKPLDTRGQVEGRFPANIILDETAADFLDEHSGITSVTGKRSQKSIDNCIEARKRNKGNSQCDVGGNIKKITEYPNDKGGASRFFYQAKVSKKERNMGLDGFDETTTGGKGHGLDRRCSHCNTSMLKPEDCKCEEPNWITPPKKNSHPTVKPVSLMAYLCRLITPPNGIVLDPFMGSGSTGIAAQLEGFRFCGMEVDENYFKIAESRINSYEDYREFLKK